MDALGSGAFMVSPGDIDHPPEPPGSPADVYWTIEKYMGDVARMASSGKPGWGTTRPRPPPTWPGCAP